MFRGEFNRLTNPKIWQILIQMNASNLSNVNIKFFFNYLSFLLHSFVYFWY